MVSKFSGKTTDFRYSDEKGLNDLRTSYCIKKKKKPTKKPHKTYQRQNQKDSWANITTMLLSILKLVDDTSKNLFDDLEDLRKLT